MVSYLYTESESEIPISTANNVNVLNHSTRLSLLSLMVKSGNPVNLANDFSERQNGFTEIAPYNFAGS